MKIDDELERKCVCVCVCVCARVRHMLMRAYIRQEVVEQERQLCDYFIVFLKLLD